MTNDQIEPDGVLSMLVTTANALTETHDGIGITLTLSGQVVSGKLISHWKWFDDMARNLNQLEDENYPGPKEERPDGMGSVFAEMHDVIVSHAKEVALAREAAVDLAQRYKDAISAEDTVRFVHLMDARVFTPGQKGLPTNGMYWRGRLVDVAGWSFGQFLWSEN